VDRLVDLNEPIDPAATPLEAAEAIDAAFVPLAATYSRSLYGDEEQAAALVTIATEDHDRAQSHLTTRYSRGERIVATYRPSRLTRRWRALRQRLTPGK